MPRNDGPDQRAHADSQIAKDRPAYPPSWHASDMVPKVNEPIPCTFLRSRARRSDALLPRPDNALCFMAMAGRERFHSVLESAKTTGDMRESGIRDIIFFEGF